MKIGTTLQQPMIDLHSHILPGIDDGALNDEMALEMARIAAADGTRIMACTPHFMPGRYDTTMQELLQSMRRLSSLLSRRGINLRLVRGGDLHLQPDMQMGLDEASLPCLAKSRYFLLEPPHHIRPPGLVAFCKKLIDAGYHPVLTHPERLTWIEAHYATILELSDIGVVMQVTASSVTGAFGRDARAWAERLIKEYRVDILASDAHNVSSRPPGLSKARDQVAQWVGEETAIHMVYHTPLEILRNRPISSRATVPAIKSRFSWLKGFKHH